MREILGLGCPWCSRRSLWMVSHPQREPFSPPAKHEELAKKGPENISTPPKTHTKTTEKHIYEVQENTESPHMVPTWFPHVPNPSSRCGGAEPCWRKTEVEVGWTWKRASISTWCGTSVEPWKTWDIMGPKHAWNLNTKHGWITWDESDIIWLCDTMWLCSSSWTERPIFDEGLGGCSSRVPLCQQCDLVEVLVTDWIWLDWRTQKKLLPCHGIRWNSPGFHTSNQLRRRAAPWSSTPQDTNAIVKLKQDEIELTRKVPFGDVVETWKPSYIYSLPSRTTPLCLRFATGSLRLGSVLLG